MVDDDAFATGADAHVEATEWDRFVIRHRKPGNLAVHLVSFILFWGGPIAAWALWDARWLIAFFASGPVGALGHFVFRDGRVDLRETTSRPTVVFYVTRMFWRLLRGTYFDDVRAAEAKLAVPALRSTTSRDDHATS